jgi:hypothetical protein
MPLKNGTSRITGDFMRCEALTGGLTNLTLTESENGPFGLESEGPRPEAFEGFAEMIPRSINFYESPAASITDVAVR